jgi:hypothetical protein
MFSLLKELTGLDFGYKPDGPIEGRNKSSLKWEQLTLRAYSLSVIAYGDPLSNKL